MKKALDASVCACVLLVRLTLNDWRCKCNGMPRQYLFPAIFVCISPMFTWHCNIRSQVLTRKKLISPRTNSHCSGTTHFLVDHFAISRKIVVFVIVVFTVVCSFSYEFSFSLSLILSGYCLPVLDHLPFTKCGQKKFNSFFLRQHRSNWYLFASKLIDGRRRRNIFWSNSHKIYIIRCIESIP